MVMRVFRPPAGSTPDSSAVPAARPPKGSVGRQSGLNLGSWRRKHDPEDPCWDGSRWNAADGPPLNAFLADVIEGLKQRPVANAIIDLLFNAGGDNTLTAAFIKACPTRSRPVVVSSSSRAAAFSCQTRGSRSVTRPRCMMTSTGAVSRRFAPAISSIISSAYRPGNCRLSSLSWGVSPITRGARIRCC
jgi:hypothetical protein